MTPNAAQLMMYESAINKLNEATKAYDEGHPIMTDKEWDELYFQVVAWENGYKYLLPNSPTQKIIYEVVSQLNKVTHNHQMLSLDKTKDWNEFLNYFYDINPFKDVVGMIKLDGLTCSLRYTNGKLVSAETRGNGEIGEDILHNAKVINSIPNVISYKEELIVDGEIICTTKDFEEFSDEYKNPRNFAAGSIRLLDSRECANRKLTFVVWNIVKGFDDENSFMHKLNEVEKLGFTITPWTSSFDWDAKEFLQDQAAKYGYPIDGLVGRFDDIEFGNSLGSTEHHSRAAFAFKFYDETYPTTLKDIEWTMGRTGVLTPVAIFEPLDIDGSVVERASLHNMSVMYETLNRPFVGQKISVFKANMIIPQIAWAEEDDERTKYYLDYPHICPICGEPTVVEISDSGVDNLVCGNPNCEGKLINRLDHYCGKKGLDIKGLSKATLEKLIDWGWVSNILDLYTLREHEAEWVNKAGFGVKSVGNVLSAIENSKNSELHSFISALGIPLIGSTYAKTICKKDFDWHNFRECVEGRFDFTKWDGFGVEMCSALWKFNYEEADKLAFEVLNLTNSLWVDPNVKETTVASLDGITICITGKLNLFKNRAELQSKIEECGGKVTGSVSKNTNYLINNDNTSTSAKNMSATKLGIPVITEEEFFEKFLKNS